MPLGEELVAVKTLFERDDNVPASLADACLVRMSELYEPCRVLTLDSDFPDLPRARAQGDSGDQAASVERGVL